jgi:hypothetical protein
MRLTLVLPKNRPRLSQGRNCSLLIFDSYMSESLLKEEVWKLEYSFKHSCMTGFHQVL